MIYSFSLFDTIRFLLSCRHGDFIPYDHDADIAVIGSQADLIRSLSVHWSNVNASRPNLISRPGDYSINDHGSRLNCQGIPVHYQLDPCAFFSPIARLISGYFTFLDVFLVHPRLVMDTNDDGRTQLWLFDEEADADKGVSLSYPLDAVFPLNTCQFIGLRLPCPRKPEVVLTHLYGPDFIRPSKKCNQVFGFWYPA
ncbi:hypothetical protein P879_04570 [Paragonimus westermani]|uniref:Uncharacterized protein n=1 Tax=Paragonimus westermani TaxID=34504 RepID=A0A8T0DQ52_9TREM|nr:hypothetical protein P879_04570 [Paragonimus westermani]